MLGFRLKRMVYVATVVGGILIAWLILNTKPTPQARALAIKPVPIVDVISMQPAQHQLLIRTQGVLEPTTRIQLVAQVAGRVESITSSFARGGYFNAGDALVNIEDIDYRIAISQAKATLANAKQLLASEKGAARQAKREWRDLGSADANELFLRKPQLASAEAAVEAARAGLEKAQLNLARTQLKLPFAGQVLEKSVDIGQFVGVGTVLGEVFSTQGAEVRLPLTSRQRYQVALSEGSPVRLFTRAGNSDYQWDATLARIEAAVDRESRQYFAVVSIDNPFEASVISQQKSESLEKIMRPPLSVGQFLQAEISGAYVDNSFAIPRVGLRQANQVWLVDAQGLIHITQVEVVQSNTQNAIVTLPEQFEFKPPMYLITSDLSLAIEGMQVQLAAEAI